MSDTNPAPLYRLVLLMGILSIITAATGLFYNTGDLPFEVVNQYGEIVKLYGSGLYAHDSYFKAPIFRGTDLVILLVVVPLLMVTLFKDLKKRSLRTRLMLTSTIAVVMYYAASISFGVTYNFLQLAYIALFSVSFFALILAMISIDYRQLEREITVKSYTGIYIFLVVTGAALMVAWLPDIVGSLLAGRSLALIQVYTTEITYVLDMGIISPAAFLCLYLLAKRRGMGYVLLTILLTLCAVIGIMLPIQTVFQVSAGINIPVPALVTKMGIFVLLALFAVYFEVRLIKSFKP